ncbi:MAG: hypothetical protein WAK15_00160, partial [Candidatus Cybelea sp.]
MAKESFSFPDISELELKFDSRNERPNFLLESAGCDQRAIIRHSCYVLADLGPERGSLHLKLERAYDVINCGRPLRGPLNKGCVILM